MAQYITRPDGHDATYVGPYHASGVNLRLYILNSTYATLSATLDRYLNAVAPKGRKYVPLGDRVVGCFAAMAKVVGGDPTLGYMREIDVAFFIPALCFDGIIPKQVVFFAPYLFVDIPQAVTTGREVHGYRKDFGTSFSAKDTYADAWVPNAADLTHVDAWAVQKPADQLKRRRLVDVTAAPPGAPIPWSDPLAALGEIFTELIGDLKGLLGGVGTAFGNQPSLLEPLLKPLLKTLFSALLGKAEVTLPIVFLRQFRDPRHTEQADVCEIVTADTRIPLAQLSGVKLPGSYQLTFHDMASHPFSKELGMPSGTAMPSGLTIEATCGFTLEEGS